MGCWNKTCGISNLPIYAGDPVYVFLLEGDKHNNHCYNNHLYSPVLVPFYSYYDDYGAGENSHGIGLRVIIDALKKQLIEREVGENEYHDIAVKREEMNETLLFESMREGRLAIPNVLRFLPNIPNKPQETNIDFLMMRKDVVDEILNTYRREDYVHDYVNFEGEYRNYGFSDLVNEVNTLVDHYAEATKKCKELEKLGGAEDTVEYWRMLWNLEDPSYTASALKGKSPLLSIWTPNYSYGGASLVRVMEVFTQMVRDGDLDSAKELYIEYLKGAWIDRFMDEARKSWIPQCGEGSQDTDTGNQEFLATLTLKVANKDKTRWDEEDVV